MRIHPNVASALSTSDSTNNPAQAARAARASDAQLQNVSFGEIVSAFARGLPISNLQTSTSTLGGSQTSGSGGTTDPTASPQPQS